MDESVNSKSLKAWLTAAMAAPIAHFCGGNWIVLVILSTLALGLFQQLGGTPTFLQSKCLCAIQLVWLIVLSAQYLGRTARYWPGEKSDYVVPAVILLLAAYACTKRASASSGVVYWLLVLMLIPTGFALVKDAKAEWLLSKNLSASGWVLPILLFPAAAKWLQKEDGKSCIPVAVYAIGILQWMATSAILSPTLASQSQTPLRELSRTLTLGAASRFESLVSVMVMLSWFCFAALCIQLCWKLCLCLGIRRKAAIFGISTAVIALIWLDVQLNPMFSSVITLFLWVLVPMLHEKKLSKKSEKSA